MAFAISGLHMQIEHTEFQDQLVRGLTHRMNNILTLFAGYAGLLLDNKKLDRATIDGLTKIKDGAKLASELMDRTHSLVRPTTLVVREVKLVDFVRMMRPSFDSLRPSNTWLEIECPEELPSINADALRVKTAIFEIVRNAFEATLPGGTVKIELSAEPQAPLSSAEQPVTWVSLTVTDNGAGVSEEIGDRIFQPFFSTKKKLNSVGLGLTVALGVVQQLGGVLRYESRPGRTVFQMLLPARAEGT